MDWQIALLLFGAIVAVIVGIARWFGASRLLAFSIPIVPLVVWMVYCFATGAAAVGEGGAMALWIVVFILLLIALPVGAVTVFIVPKRHGKPCA